MAIYTIKTGNILGDRFGIVPNEIIISKNLTMPEKVLYAYLSSLLSNGNIELPSFEKIAEDLNISQATAKKYFNNLIANGYIEKTDKED